MNSTPEKLQRYSLRFETILLIFAGILCLVFLLLMQTTYAIPDTEFFPSAKRIFEIHDQMTADEMKDYWLIRMLDMIFPLCYSIFFYVSLKKLTFSTTQEMNVKVSKPAHMPKSKFNRISHRAIPYIPCIAMIADYTENIVFYESLQTYPKRGQVAHLAAWPNAVKWLFLILTGISMIYLLTFRIRNARHRS